MELGPRFHDDRKINFNNSRQAQGTRFRARKVVHEHRNSHTVRNKLSLHPISHPAQNKSKYAALLTQVYRDFQLTNTRLVLSYHPSQFLAKDSCITLVNPLGWRIHRYILPQNVEDCNSPVRFAPFELKGFLDWWLFRWTSQIPS